MPLKHIPMIISPDLLYTLACMGHGDEVVCIVGLIGVTGKYKKSHITDTLLKELYTLFTKMNVLADAHFPTSSICRHGPKEVRADGLGIPKLLEAVLTLMPLDQYVSQPVAIMDKVPEDKAKGLPTPIWTDYQVIADNAEGTQIEIEKVERFKFYERAKKAYAVVHTGETAQYGNIILKKGVVKAEKPPQ